MRFSVAWAKTAAQNVTLKVATVTLAVVTIGELLTISSLASRDPLVIERGCYSRVVSVSTRAPDENEMKSFLLEALPMRFDSTASVRDGYLSIDEAAARAKEQALLQERQISQKIVIENISFNGTDITVDADRLISVEKIKTVLPLNLKVVLDRTTRTETDPYGLIISSVSQIKENANQ